jgi:GNAT superfamily N-acetyltransferase
MANGFTIRMASDEDRRHVMSAVSLLVPEVDVERRHRWLYEDNPHGRALTWVAIDDATGEIAGATSLFPRRISVDGRDVLAALGGDGYVHEKFRRRGIATAMHGATREAMKLRGIEIMFGTPLAGNVTPLAQHDTRDVVEIARYVRPNSARVVGLPGSLDAVVRRIQRRRRPDLKLDAFRERDPRLDAIWTRARADLAIAAVRDAELYDWRFRRSFVATEQAFVVLDAGEPIAACALERIGRRMRILDLLAPRDAWSRALEAVIASADDYNFVELKLARADAKARGLWRWGFIERGAKPLNVMIPDDSTRRDVYFDGSKWFFTCM